MKTYAFTRVELLAVMGAASLLGLLALSVCASNKDVSDRAVCANNLRHIGRAFNLWASDHRGENPVSLSVADGGLRNPSGYLSVPGGGTWPAQFAQNLWFHYYWIHRELQTPTVLVCPSDPKPNRATSFSTSPEGGFLNPAFQTSALSYFLGLHPRGDLAHAILSGDRHIITSSTGGCSTGYQASNLGPVPYSPSGWTNGPHYRVGNLLLNDGRVEEFTDVQLNQFLRDTL